MKKLNDKLAGFGIEAAIQHALTLNEEADNAHMIILSCGNAAWYRVIEMITYIELPHNRFITFPSRRPAQYPGATGLIYFEGGRILVLPDKSLGDRVFVIHDEDYQWSVSTTVDSP